MDQSGWRWDRRREGLRTRDFTRGLIGDLIEGTGGQVQRVLGVAGRTFIGNEGLDSLPIAHVRDLHVLAAVLRNLVIVTPKRRI